MLQGKSRAILFSEWGIKTMRPSTSTPSLRLNLPDLKGSVYLHRHLAPSERLEIFWDPSGHASKPLTLHPFPICPEILHFQCRPRESFRLIWVARKAQKERLETTLCLKPEKSHRKPHISVSAAVSVRLWQLCCANSPKQPHDFKSGTRIIWKEYCNVCTAGVCHNGTRPSILLKPTQRKPPRFWVEQSFQAFALPIHAKCLDP